MPWTPSDKNNGVKYERFHSMYVPHREKLSSPKSTGKKKPNPPPKNNKNVQPLKPKSKENRGKNTLCLGHTAISLIFKSNDREV